jgi:hypothetical protein
MIHPCTEVPKKSNTSEHFLSTIYFVKNFPKNVPVYLTCSYPKHGDVEMLVTPIYYHINAFRCTILAVSNPLIPQGYTTRSESTNCVDINVESIKSWRLWDYRDNFLNFGSGYVSEEYLKMILN